MKQLIGGLLIVAGFLTMIGLSLYLLITGLIYLFQNGGNMSGSEIFWELILIIFRDVISVAAGIIILLIGAGLAGSKRKIPSFWKRHLK